MEKVLEVLRGLLGSPVVLRLLTVLLAAGVAGVGVSIVDEDGDGPLPPRLQLKIIRTEVDRSPAPGVQPLLLEVPAPVVKQATDDLHTGLNEGDAPEDPFPSAAATQRGCSTRTVRNMSSRRGVEPRNIVLHYTVGPNRPGLSDMDGTTTLANSPAAGVSWHFLIDREGHCYYSVPLTMKAWTQANANPFSVGIEIVNSGRERNLTGGAGKRKLALVVSDTARKLDIPLGVGWAPACSPEKPGVVDHFHLGACGGGHHDITPYGQGGVKERVGPYVRAAWKLRKREAQPWCSKNVAAREGGVTAREAKRIRARRGKIRDRELRCVDGRIRRR